MKIKVLFLLAVVFMLSISSHAQRGVRIGYIDTEYILENVPEYQQATAQLDQKVKQCETAIDCVESCNKILTENIAPNSVSSVSRYYNNRTYYPQTTNSTNYKEVVNNKVKLNNNKVIDTTKRNTNCICW